MKISRSPSDIADLMLDALRAHPDTGFTAEELSTTFRITPRLAEELMTALRQSGYAIQYKKGTYRIKEFTEPLAERTILSGLKTKILGRRVFCFRSIASTNDTGFLMAESGAKEGTLLIADRQSKGKGRLGRSWHSPPKVGLWFSLILRPKVLPSQAPGLSLAAALALAETIEAYTSLEVEIKWPNDCLINGRKVAGILTELSAELDKINFVVVGVGVNVNHKKSDFPLSLRRKATSLFLASNKSISRVRLLQDFLVRFEEIYSQFVTEGLKPILPRLKKRAHLLGKKVKLQLGKKVFRGLAAGLDSSGSLILETKTGREVVTAGEVTIV